MDSQLVNIIVISQRVAAETYGLPEGGYYGPNCNVQLATVILDYLYQVITKRIDDV